ncbi:hypothetical protein ACFFX1_12770 [Dactylosporangium sucinum]|uniref:Uncharacterized protein n=1 Tax=Dactylosporangium sucinum TaxID=1424081 RepID=A0A917TXF7_9ACTN|nr:hypothetical protein [Dactylosporangium sucinum]GGM41410.1 hypothetical protein GCM10007977_048510 [Dactylosporangium sucinum]
MSRPPVVTADEWRAAPYGRREAWEDSPEGWPQTPTMQWLRPHDEYEVR